MRLLQRAKTLLTGIAVVLLFASTTYAEPALAKGVGFHHGGKFHSDFYFKGGHGKVFHHYDKNQHFFGKKSFIYPGYKFGHKFSHNFGHSKKGVFKKSRGHGFNRSRSFGKHRSFGHRRSFRRH